MRSQWNKVNNNTEILSPKRLRDSLSSFYISLKEVKPEDSALFTLTELVLMSGLLAVMMVLVVMLVMVGVAVLVLVEAGVLAVEESVGQAVHSMN